MADRFEGRVVMVTGAGSGLGATIAESFAVVGASVALVDRDAEAVRNRAESLRAKGLDAHARAADVTDADVIASVVDATVSQQGSLDILVNSAGVRFITPFLEQPVKEWRKTIEVNLTGTFICAQAAARVMIDKGWGRIINIASTTGILALTKRSSYAASKAGVIGLTKAMAFELTHTGVTTNAIAPGPFETPMNAPYFRDEQMTSILRREIPRGTWGEPDELVGAVQFLASDAASYISGAVLAVDGGWLSGKGY